LCLGRFGVRGLELGLELVNLGQGLCVLPGRFFGGKFLLQFGALGVGCGQGFVGRF